MVQTVLDALSESGIGALLVNAQGEIETINRAGDRLLHGAGGLVGRRLNEVAPFLCAGGEHPPFGNPAFNEYLLPCPAPAVEGLPAGARLYAFRDATIDYRYTLLDAALRHSKEAVTIYDLEGRLIYINEAAEQLESHFAEDVMGKKGTALFQPDANSVLCIPQVLAGRKAVQNLKQHYVTHLGKELQVVANGYPVTHHGELLAAICFQEDLTRLDELHQRIADLQSAVLDKKRTGRRLDDGMAAQYRFSDIVCAAPTMRNLIEKCRMIARSDSAVMIYGETGTGKELFAQSIHNASRRKDGPFLAINCAAIPDTLLEGILFGTEKGAYTGATTREGLLEQAHGGTLLLDELNSMDIQLQSKLLRFLQDGSLRRVGGVKDKKVDVRILSNLNVPPQEAIAQKLLRQDLFYRLGVINLTLPPLRDRPEDIPLLARTFLRACGKKVGKHASGLRQDALDVLAAYPWPGNVRELQHAIEYAMNILPDDADELGAVHLPDHILAAAASRVPQPTPEPAPQETIRSVTDRAVRTLIVQTLRTQEGNITRAAERLGIARQNLQHYIKKLDIHPDEL